MEEELKPLVKVDLNKLDDTEINRKITLQEFNDTLKTFKDKTPGETGIPLKALIELSEKEKTKIIPI